MAELGKRERQVRFVFHRTMDQQEIAKQLILSFGLDAVWVDDNRAALALYQQDKPDWVIFGNAYPFTKELKSVTKTALMQHGIGPKACYYEVSEAVFDVRFVEGQHRLARLQALFPEQTFIDTGYAKLDPLINGLETGLDLKSLGLDPGKKTLLYAPTFYPSTIEAMDRNWPKAFAEYNILIKPHYFSLTKPSYRKQAKLLHHWADFDNVYLATVEEINLLPFMASADLLISDASSALFEFAALDKPVVWCDFYHLRWSYRGIFSFRFKNRMDEDLYRYADVAVHAKDYRSLKSAVDQQIKEPNSFRENRSRYTEELAGIIDGRCSIRIVDYLLG
ncbi:CDP-glycerol glycerophosphotransferase family protein [Shewanella cyperi]|uniref:CDP-glycerol glycerophosphotransferase family protein n=2 Tax=Shewanella cyperi TaxID=2814292 RepID=A0A974XNN5_9GAMM|nr:CDP-glycerol glycerophosphotransferase family protein [Shewanella cyperi]